MGKRGEGERGGRGKGIIINNNGRVMRGGGERRDMKIIKLINNNNRERRLGQRRRDRKIILYFEPSRTLESLSLCNRSAVVRGGSAGSNHPKLSSPDPT